MNRTPAAALATLLVSGAWSTAFAAVVDPSALDFLPQSPGVVGGAVGGIGVLGSSDAVAGVKGVSSSQDGVGVWASTGEIEPTHTAPAEIVVVWLPV